MKFEPFVRSAYNYDRDEASLLSGLECKDVSMAKQEFAEEVDINTIIRRFNVGGDLPENVRAPTYGDFTGIDNFQEAVNAIAAANESFDAMPAAVRARFGNNTEAFVEFCSDPANVKEMEKLGLKNPATDDRLPVPTRVGPNGDDDGKARSGIGGVGKGLGGEVAAAAAPSAGPELR